MCHLRGIVMQKIGRVDQAKECFMEALGLDVKCYESFEKLVSTEMMTSDEGWRQSYRLSLSINYPPQSGSSCNPSHIRYRPRRMQNLFDLCTRLVCASTNIRRNMRSHVRSLWNSITWATTQTFCSASPTPCISHSDGTTVSQSHHGIFILCLVVVFR